VASLSFLTPSGDLDVHTGAAALARALGAAEAARADCDFNDAYRRAVSALANASKKNLTLQLGESTLVLETWAMGVVKEMVLRGRTELYTKEDLRDLSTHLDTFSRAAAREDATLAAAGARARPNASSFVFPASDADDVFAASPNYQHPCPNQCEAGGRPWSFGKNKSLCQNCGGFRDSFICTSCNLPTPAAAPICGNASLSGCPAASRREPRAGEMAAFGQRCKQAAGRASSAAAARRAGPSPLVPRGPRVLSVMAPEVAGHYHNGVFFPHHHDGGLGGWGGMGGLPGDI